LKHYFSKQKNIEYKRNYNSMNVIVLLHESNPRGQTVPSSTYIKTVDGARIFKMCWPDVNPNDFNKVGLNQLLRDTDVPYLLTVNPEFDPIESFTLYSYQANNFANGTYRRFTEEGGVDGWQAGHILMLLPNSLRRMYPKPAVGANVS